MDRVDVVVLGAGPSGLGAALALASTGASVAVLEASDRTGGLCATVARDGFRYDLGGHIPFVRDEPRRAWLEQLLEGDLHWVDRPVSCVRGSAITPGRYLDQRPTGDLAPAEWNITAQGELGSRFGDAFVDQAMRPYLEKIDGVPLEQIPGQRAVKLMVDQAAPEGFWFPGAGIGQLMDALAAATEQAGGQILRKHRVTEIACDGGAVAGVRASGPEGARELACDAVVVGIPAAIAAAAVRPEAPAGVIPEVAMRAVCLVMLVIDQPTITDHAWIQVDDPAVPFARAFEPTNWSPRCAVPGRSVIGLECYCQADADDPVWSLTDADLARRCATTLANPLGWIDDPGRAAMLEVICLPRAYPVADLAQAAQVRAPHEWISQISGVELAPGAAVIEAIEMGEAAAQAILARGQGAPTR